MELEARADSELRCALCHDEVAEPRHTCPRCGSRLHPECRAGLGRCPTLGCVVDPARAMWEPRSRVPRPTIRTVGPTVAAVGFVLLQVVGHWPSRRVSSRNELDRGADPLAGSSPGSAPRYDVPLPEAPLPRRGPPIAWTVAPIASFRAARGHDPQPLTPWLGRAGSDGFAAARLAGAPPVEFSVGWGLVADAATVVSAPPGWDHDLLRIATTPAWDGPDVAAELYALVDGRWVLVRAERADGRLAERDLVLRGLGPPLGDRPESAWRAGLLAAEPAFVLEALTRMRIHAHAYARGSKADDVALGIVRTLLAHPDPWVAEAARDCVACVGELAGE